MIPTLLVAHGRVFGVSYLPALRLPLSTLVVSKVVSALLSEPPYSLLVPLDLPVVITRPPDFVESFLRGRGYLVRRFEIRFVQFRCRWYVSGHWRRLATCYIHRHSIDHVQSSP